MIWYFALRHQGEIALNALFIFCRNTAEGISHHVEQWLLHAGLGKEFFFGLRFQAEFFSEQLEQFDPMITEHITIGCDII